MFHQGPVRNGFVGFSKGGCQFHAPLIDAAEGCEVGAIVARSTEKQADAKTDYPDIPIFKRIGEMAKAKAVDKELAETLRRAGPHVNPLDSLAALERLDAAKKSATTGQVLFYS